MTNNKRNINHARFIRKEKEGNKGNDHDLTKEDPWRKEIANLNRCKFFCRKIWTHLHQKRSARHTQLSKLGQNFSIEKFWVHR